MNHIKAFLFLAAISIFLLAFGEAVGSYSGFFIALVVVLFMLANVWFADRIILRFTGAVKMTEAAAASVTPIVKLLSEKMGMPIPQLYLIQSDAPNLMAIGFHPRSAKLIVTSGFLQQLTPEEWMATLANMMFRILNRASFVGSTAAVVTAPIVALANLKVWRSLFKDNTEKEIPEINGRLLVFFGPMAAVLIRLIVAPARVFASDKAAIMLCGHSEWLVSAMQKMDQSKVILYGAETHPTIAHLFLTDPLRTALSARIFATFPPVQERVAQ